MSVGALFAACVLIWGTTWYAITFQLAGATPEVATALRFSVAATVLVAWCLWRRVTLRFSWPVHVWLALLGILNFSAAYVLVYFAELYIVSGLVAVGYSAMPLINMALARVFFGTPLSSRIGLAGVCGIAGIVLIFWPEFERLMAYGGAATWLLVIVRSDPIAIVWTPHFVASLIYLSVFGSVIAFGAYFALMARVGPARSAYVGVMSTVVALFVSAIFEVYDWRWATVLGVGLAIIGNVLALNVKPNIASDKPVA